MIGETRFITRLLKVFNSPIKISSNIFTLSINRT